ncbi:hypothetical protein GN156_10760 [bacterium LRH843]|nr:hypothetical protein [bacterium LRH843]
MAYTEILPSRGLLCSYKKWCPACYEQDFKNNSYIYERLIWNFQLVNFCS